MNTPMNLPEPTLEQKARELFDAAFEALKRQVVCDPAHPQHGAWISPETGWDEPAHVGQGRWFAFLYLAYLIDPERHGRAWLLDAMAACGDYWMRVRRPTGRVDLRNCNQDSGPDTAFVVQLLVACFELGKMRRAPDEALEVATEKVREFACDAALALMDGGFHTPNHRWVMVSAMAQAVAFWPELGEKLEPAIAALMAEQPDIDAEGAFIERSIAVYDAVNVRSLLLAHRHHGWPEGLAAARKCLEFDLDLFHPDGTVDTQLSHRYDFGSRPVPLPLIATYQMFGRVTGDAMFARQAAWMFRNARNINAQQAVEVLWLIVELLHGNTFSAETAPLPDIEVHHAKNRIVRLRRNGASLSLYGGTNRLMSLVCGQATLHAVMAGQSYLGHGRFVADKMNGGNGVYVLESNGRLEPHRLGYAQPLQRVVTQESWAADYAVRELRAMPDCTSRIVVGCDWEKRELHLRYESLDGMPGVAAQLSLDFEPGGVWESDDCALKPLADQVLVLKRGAGRMFYDGDWIEIAGGSDGHRPWAMRDYPASNGRVRVTLPLITPVDHHVVIRWGTVL